jgi:hypothetical protein
MQYNKLDLPTAEFKQINNKKGSVGCKNENRRVWGLCNFKLDYTFPLPFSMDRYNRRSL